VTAIPGYTGPYSIAAYENGPARRNDGSMVIFGVDADGERAPVLTVPMRVEAKRGKAWCTSDPEQERFAAFVVDLLNGAAK